MSRPPVTLQISLAPSDYAHARTLLAAGYFEAIAFSGEDRQRADFYQDNARRVTLQKQAGEMQIDDTGRRFDPQFKGGWSPEMALTHNYTHHLTVIRRDIVAKAGGLRPELQGEISFDNVTFRYPGASGTALDRATFTIAAGSVVGIVGMTPAARPLGGGDAATFEARVQKFVRLTPENYDRNIFHVEIDIAGTGLEYHIGSALGVLAAELQRRWNPNCEVEGGRDVQVRTTFMLGPTGMVIGEVSSQIRAGSTSGVAQAAAERASRAVYAAQPFKNLPRELYGQRIAVNFNAREACS